MCTGAPPCLPPHHTISCGRAPGSTSGSPGAPATRLKLLGSGDASSSHCRFNLRALPAVLIPGLPSPLWSGSSGFHRLCSFPALSSLGVADPVFCPRPHLAQRSNDIRAEMKAVSATAAPGNRPAEMLSSHPQEVPRGRYRPSQFPPVSLRVVFQLFRCPRCRVQSPRPPPLLPAPLRTSPPAFHTSPALREPAPHLSTSAPLACIHTTLP